MATILVVDDEPSLRLTMTMLLRARGHRVCAADGVTAALGVLATERPDIVVTDLRMPDGAGLDVLRAAKAHCPEADVIVLTGYAGWESAKEAMQLGAADYFEKGHDPEGLLQRIARSLEEQARRRGTWGAPGAPHAPPNTRHGPGHPDRASISPHRHGLPGARAPLNGERAFLTVLFADLRGSLELLAARGLEEGRMILDAVLERMMEAVRHEGGIVNQVMGDGIMALFGAPVPCHDHAPRGCRAAVRMQAAVRRYAGTLRDARGIDLQIRVGLNSGEAIVRSIGSDVGQDYSAVGQTTHLAARMEQLADPGSILLTAETLSLAEGFLHATPLGPMAVKGLPIPVAVFELAGISAASSRLSSRT
jgi:class 3 adenylate cyclase/CheY-like chemotaxis protein